MNGRQVVSYMGASILLSEKNLSVMPPPTGEQARRQPGRREFLFLHIRTLFYTKTGDNARVFVIFSG